ncbi:MAG: prepilin-type N-terminal cleavage/methylation domain-containing protein [Lachnospiraceae bacterium]|nr:prepilin-type N-terminal cleavage/methylation domain-containing protein [Lachnospiraceae bacterium]
MKNTERSQIGNEGFSLVELIVAILIMSYVSAIVVMLISSARSAYTAVNTDAVVQTEVDAVRAYVSEIAIEAVSCGAGPVSAVGGSDEGFYIWFYAPDDSVSASLGTAATEKCFYFLYHEGGENGILRCHKYPALGKNGCPFYDNLDLNSDRNGLKEGYDYYSLLVANTSTKLKGQKYDLLAEHIKDINCSADTNTGLITINLVVEYFGEEYRKNLIFAGRNMKTTIINE